jgi:hypothetical protein
MRSGSHQPRATRADWPLAHAPGRTSAERSSPSFTNFTHPAGTRMRPRRVAAKIEWHWGELYPCRGFMVTNTARPAANAVAFYNKRRTCELWINKGRGGIRLTRLSS